MKSRTLIPNVLDSALRQRTKAAAAYNMHTQHIIRYIDSHKEISDIKEKFETELKEIENPNDTELKLREYLLLKILQIKNKKEEYDE